MLKVSVIQDLEQSKQKVSLGIYLWELVSCSFEDQAFATIIFNIAVSRVSAITVSRFFTFFMMGSLHKKP